MLFLITLRILAPNQRPQRGQVREGKEQRLTEGRIRSRSISLPILHHITKNIRHTKMLLKKSILIEKR